MFDWLLCKIFPYRDIVKTVDGEVVLYLRRWFLWRRRGDDSGDGGGVFLHRICRSDDDPDPHDHPWDFTTFVLCGGYVDEQWVMRRDADGVPVRSFRSYETVPVFAKVSRPAEHVHRVLLNSGRHAWTLVLAGPYRRSWGFVKKDGWVYFKQYLGIE